MLSYFRGELTTLTEAIQHHRSKSSYLFNDLHQTSVPVKSEEADNTCGTVAEPPQKRQRPPKSLSRGDDVRGKQPEKYALNGKEICTFYNGAGCRKGDRCAFAHYCSFSGCNKKHARSENHPGNM